MLAFTNPRVTKEFEALTDYDPVVHVLPIYTGKLSEISFAAAQKMVADKSNLIVKKQATELPLKEEKPDSKK